MIDAYGHRRLAVGDTARPVFPRSAVKAIQALPFVESGAADGLPDEALALACASHGGERMHVEMAARMLASVGLDESALGCGAHWPLHQPATLALAASGRKPTQLHNNCSGKHAGFLCLACAEGWPLEGYVGADHPVQDAVRGALADLTTERLAPETRATDGCAIPTYAIPLHSLAFAFAQFGTGEGCGPERRKAAARLRSACTAHPDYVAGSGRFCTSVMRLFGEDVFVKTGAEGVFCGALPRYGLGFAVKADDGGSRAAEVITAALIDALLPMSDEQRAALKPHLAPEIRNWNGMAVGGMRPAEGWLERRG